MAPPNNAQSSPNEGNILLAIQAIRLGQISSMRKAAAQYNIPFSTLRRRMNGSQSKEDWVPPKQRLTPAEEEALL